MQTNEDPRRAKALIIVPLLTLALAGAVGGHLYSVELERLLEREAEAELSNISALKARQLQNWRTERMGDGETLFLAARLMPELQEILQRGQAVPATGKTGDWLRGLCRHFGYVNAVLTGARGDVLMKAGETPSEDTGETARWVMAAGRAVLRDFHAHRKGRRAGLTLGIPLTGPGGAAQGAILLGIDPERAIFPLLQDWRTTGETGEAFLIRQEGDQLVNLTPLRYGNRAPLSLRMSLQDGLRPAVQAAKGARGLVRGRNYRDREVIASVQKVEGTPWFLIVLKEKAEIHAPLHRQTSFIALALIGLWLAEFAVGAWLLRRQRMLDYQARLREEEKRRALIGHYGLLARYANDIIYLADEDERIIEANERALAAYGYEDSGLVGVRCRQLRPEDQLEAFAEKWKVLTERGSLVYESEHQRRDGMRFPVEVSARVVELEGRSYRQFVARDITERRQAELRLKQLNRLYSVLRACGQSAARAKSEWELFETTCRAAVEYGGFKLVWTGLRAPVGTTIPAVASFGEAAEYLNEARITTMGPEGEGPAGRSIRSGMAEVCRDIAEEERMAPWRDLAARYGLRSSASLPLRRGGEVIGTIGFYSGESDFFGEKEIQLLEAVAEDVSHALESLDQELLRIEAELSLRRALEEVKESNARFLLVGRMTRTKLYELKPSEGRMKWLSADMEADWGYTESSLPQRWEAYLERVHPGDRERLRAGLTATARGQEDQTSIDYRLARADGEYRNVADHWHVFRDEFGNCTQVLGALVDVTERVQAEQERLSLTEQLRQAQKMESIGRLAGGVAHDFNNMLAVIIGTGESLQRRMPEGEASPYWKPLRTMLDAADRAANLTRQLLAFSRKQAIRPRPVVLNEVIEQGLGMLQRLAGGEVRISTKLTPELWPVVADPDQIHQVLMNLIANGRDAMEGHGRIEIETLNKRAGQTGAWPAPANDGEGVLVRVSDDGRGMDEETRLRIFEPFYTTKAAGAGTGLGLATVHGIVEQAGGWIGVESEPGKGTAFTIVLPRSEHAGDEAQEAEAGAENGAEGKHTVLLVEDEEDVRGFVLEALSQLGHEVLEAPSGRRALEMCAELKRPVDLLVTDVALPEMSGREVAALLKAKYPRLQVLFMSGYPAEVMTARRLLDEGTDFLQKPFRMGQLAKKVQEAMTGLER